jgi:hypothetical protein
MALGGPKDEHFSCFIAHANRIKLRRIFSLKAVSILNGINVKYDCTISMGLMVAICHGPRQQKILHC